MGVVVASKGRGEGGFECKDAVLFCFLLGSAVPRTATDAFVRARRMFACESEQMMKVTGDHGSTQRQLLELECRSSLEERYQLKPGGKVEKGEREKAATKIVRRLVFRCSRSGCRRLTRRRFELDCFRLLLAGSAVRGAGAGGVLK